MTRTNQLLPDGVFEQHIAVLGKTRSGKSSVMRLFVESLLAREKPVCIIDPKGDWYGLRSSADGKRSGYAVVIFGGEHADIAINAHAGAQVAELVATGNRPCIIDLGGWMVGERTRFFIDFASGLFRQTKGHRWLVIDEVHNFAPQGKVLDPDAGKMLHWANRLASEGLGKGLAIISASQRPQKVHKDFLTCAETLIAMRVIHPLDRGAVKEWIDGCPNAEKGREVLACLASMQRGEGWVWSPEIGFGPTRIAFPMFETYDSFCPRTGDAAVKLKGWADVDLEGVRVKFAATIEQARVNDPAALKKRIVALEKQLASRPQAPPVAPEIIEKPVLREGQLARVEKLAAGFNGRMAALTGELAELRKLINPAMQTSYRKTVLKYTDPMMSTPRAAKTTPGQTRLASSSNGTIGKTGLRRMMIALAQRPGLTNRQLGLRAGLSSKSGTFGTYLGTARSAGWIRDEGDRRVITEEGRAALGEYSPLPERRELLDHWLRELGASGIRRMLEALAGVHPQTMTNEQLGQAAGVVHTSGTFGTYLGRLRTLELVTGPRGAIRASDELFD